jgi:hypothetical protein
MDKTFGCLLLIAAAVLINAVSPARGTAVGQPDVSDFSRLIAQHGEALASVGSERDALALFKSTLAPALGLNAIIPALSTRDGADPAPAGLEAAIGLSTELAAWDLARAIQRAADRDDRAQWTSLETRLSRQRWIVSDRAELAHAAKLNTVLSQPRLPFPDGAEAAFQRYAASMDTAYPDLIEGERSWLQVALQSGTDGIRQRLTSAEPVPDAWIARYFDTRIRPVLTAQAAALAVRAEVSAEQWVRRHWIRLRDWTELGQQRKRLARLCGTWQWTVHNHRNHQDHKTVIAFPPAEVLESADSQGLRPQKVVVLGDNVYLRWEFQGSIQEDSLLFTGEGQRLEGSFTNSAGAWGSITGKRIAGCEAPAKR